MPSPIEPYELHQALLRAPRPAGESLEARVNRLEAEREILDTLMAYSVFYDAGDIDALAEVFTSDAVVENRVVGTFTGRAEIHAHFTQLAGLARGAHLIVNPIVRVESADRARAGSVLYAVGSDRQGDMRGSIGTYSDVLRRESDGQWRIADRVITAELSFRLDGSNPFSTQAAAALNLAD